MTELDDVLALLAKATPGNFTVMAGTNVMAGDSFSATGLQSNLRGSDPTRNEKNAAAIIAAVNYLRANGDELQSALEDARRYRWLRDEAARFKGEDARGALVVSVTQLQKRDDGAGFTGLAVTPRGAAFDAAIDAMAAGGGE